MKKDQLFVSLMELKCAIENASDLTVEDFMQNCFFAQKPLLLKGLANLQPAGGKWTIEWFKNIYSKLFSE